MLHYMAGNDYRRGRRQVSVVVDEGLWWAVKAVAGKRGISVTGLVTGLLEDLVDDEQQAVTSTPEGSVRSATPDWAAILGAGREARVSVALDRDRERTVSLAADPLEEIA